MSQNLKIDFLPKRESKTFKGISIFSVVAVILNMSLINVFFIPTVSADCGITCETPSITVEKIGINGDDTEFSFEVDKIGYASYLQSFNLKDSENKLSHIFNNHIYRVSEIDNVNSTDDDNWTLDDISCTGQTNSTITYHKNQGYVEINVQNNEDITCTFTNVKDPICEMELTKSDADATVEPGDDLYYEITLKNTGDADCTGSGVELRESYDLNTTFVSANPAPEAGYNNYWNLETVSPGEEITIGINMVVNSDTDCPLNINNKVCVWAEQWGEKDDTANWQCVEEKTPVTCTPEPKATIKAYKVVCNEESNLPNWGTGGTQVGEPSAIDATTAQAFVNANSDVCHIESDWAFEWGWNGEAQKQDGAHIGAAPAATGWNSFDTITGTTPAEVEIDLSGTNKNIWVREELKTGYVPFANPPGDLQDAFGAELYCKGDVLNYDNYDKLNNLEDGNTYYCVAFNALKTCGDGVVNQDTEECDGTDGVTGTDTCSATCTIENGPYCGDGIKNLSEECDGTDGVTGTDTCSATCTINSDPYCGDNIKNQPWEKCDGTDNTTGETCNDKCQSGSECSDLVLAKVVINDASANAGREMFTDVYLGTPGNKIPANTWFQISDITGDTDADSFGTTPGIIVERQVNSLRLLLQKAPSNNIYGHVDGYIEFYNANIDDLRNDASGNNTLEDDSDAGNATVEGTMAANAGKDEVWLDNNKSHFWLSTTSADDAYYTDWSIIEDCADPICGNEETEDDEECDDGNTTNGDGCSATCQIEEPTLGTITACKYRDNNADGVKDTADTPLDWGMIVTRGAADDADYYSSTQTTNSTTGCITFEELELGTYIVNEGPITGGNWIQTYPVTPGTHSVLLSEANPNEAVDFLNYQKNGVINVSKYIDADASLTSTDDQTLSTVINWTITLSQSGTTLETKDTVDGLTSFDFLDPGTYTVTETMQTGWHTLTSATYNVIITQTDNTKEVTFTNAEDIPAETVKGCKYRDANNDGTIDGTEEKLSGWQIVLNQNTDGGLQEIRNTTTGEDGCYEFDDLADGTYIITETMQNFWAQTYPAAPGFFTFSIVDGVINSDYTTNDFNFANYEAFCGNDIKDDSEQCDGLDGVGEHQVCNDDCIIETTPYCGDGVCGSDESCSSCNVDCGSCGGGRTIYKVKNPKVVMTCDNATITWSSNKRADTTLVYGTSTPASIYGGADNYGYDNMTDTDSERVTAHSVVINDIEPGTNYYFRGVSKYNSQTKLTDEVHGYISKDDCTIVKGEEGAPILEVVKTVNVTTVKQGHQDVEYIVTITNNGNIAAFNVSVLDELAKGLRFSDDNEELKTWTIEELNPGEFRTFTYLVDVDEDATPGDLPNVATVTADNHGEITTLVDIEVVELPVLAESGINYIELIIIGFTALVLLGASIKLKEGDQLV